MNKVEKIKQIYENFSNEYYSDKFDNLNNLYSLVNNDTKIKEWVSKTYK